MGQGIKRAFRAARATRKPAARPLAPLAVAGGRIAANSDHVVDRVPEWRLQAAIAAEFDRRGICYAAGLEGVPLTQRAAAQALVTGMQEGEPDLRVYLPGARLVLIELKADGGGVRKCQRERHARLRALGFELHVLKAKSEAEAVAGALALIGHA